ncbi:MAG: universal stress protein [Gammaproteobacteria bacterium]|nr:universal stress protein [Gammaproteobacteria bacterium]MDD2928958.1 universal stress protein [Sideroxydans sp.]MDD5471412.1 universal stress protein [Sideroxydans sp.]
MKILIPVDGSQHSLNAVRYAIELAASLSVSPQLLLLNVQRNVATGNVKLFIDAGTIDDYEREQGMLSLQPARQVLDAAGLPYQYHLSVGQPAEAIIRYAAEQRVSGIVIGAHGEGGLGKRLLGSVVAQVLETSELPVTVVR